MNYGELKAKLTGTLHRTDLAAKLPDFVLDAQDRISRRFRIELAPLVDDEDTDQVLTGSHLLYFYAAMAEACLFLRDFAGSDMWGKAWEMEASREVVTSGRAWTDPATDADGNPPVIQRATP